MPNILILGANGQIARVATDLLLKETDAQLTLYLRRRCIRYSRVRGASAKERNSAMEITRIGSQPSGKGPEEWFTGAVRFHRCTIRPRPRVSSVPVSLSIPAPVQVFLDGDMRQSCSRRSADWMEKVGDEQYQQ